MLRLYGGWQLFQGAKNYLCHLAFCEAIYPISWALRLMKRLRASPFNMPLLSNAKSISWLTNGLSLAYPAYI